LRSVVAVYSSHPTVPLSLHARVRNFGEAEFRRMEEERVALRLPTMRGSIHLLPRETAHLAFRATVIRAQARRLRYAGVSEERYDELRVAILEAAREPRTSRQLGTETGGDGERLRAVIQTLTFEGVLLRVGAEGLWSNALRYVATYAWLEGGLPEADPGGALSWLAGEYLRAFGPARIEDFRWWTGVSKERVSSALGRIETVEAEDRCLLPATDREGFEAVEAPGRGSVDLLPKWDCYMMGHAPDGRRRLVHPDVQDRVYNEAGDALGVMFVGGAADGVWEARSAGGAGLRVDLDLFERPGASLARVIEERVEEMAALLGARSVFLG